MFKNLVGIAINKLEAWNGMVWNAHICVDTTSKEQHNCCPSPKLQINILIEKYHVTKKTISLMYFYNRMLWQPSTISCLETGMD